VVAVSLADAVGTLRTLNLDHYAEAMEFCK
jgi:hypothetical protein